MKIKRFTAPTMPEAMRAVKKEFGETAVILYTKEIVKPRLFGFFPKKYIEVTAGFETPEPPRDKSEKQIAGIENRAEKKEVGNWREMDHFWPAPLKKIDSFLQSQQFSISLRQSLMNALLKVWFQKGENLSEEAMVAVLFRELERRLGSRCVRPEKKYIELAGPTGVGKTTTIAKLAGQSALEENQQVALITADTYRIAAIDQLRTYAEILQIPLHVAYSQEEFLSSTKQFSDFDTVLIDTAGRNYLHPLPARELEQLTPPDEQMEMWLVLSLTGKYEDMKKVYERFCRFRETKIVFTKADETATFGALFNMILLEGVRVVGIANGQSVPDDFFWADAEKIVNLLKEAWEHE